MPYYAQLSENVVTAVTQTFGQIQGIGIIEIPNMADIIGCVYNPATGGFSQPKPAPVIPQSVTMRQARIALLRVNKLSLIQPAINSLPSPQKVEAQITWEYSQEVQRNNGLVSQLAPALGMTEQDIDDLFVLAFSL